MNYTYRIGGLRQGKTLEAVALSKSAQARGQQVLWATFDQTATAKMLAKHGALSEVVGDMYLAPKFRNVAPKNPTK